MSPTVQLTIVAPTPTRARSLSSRPSSPHGQRQLTARRGSVSAPDPHGTRTAPPPRSTLSRLTIVRVPQPKEAVDVAVGNVRKYNRQSSGRTSSPGPASPSRLSFASASFSAPSSPTIPPRGLSPRPASPSRMSFTSASFAGPERPQSPSPSDQRVTTSFVTSNSSASGSFQRLSPTQIYDLSKISSRPTASVLPAGHASSSSFIQLADDVYLPFVDRPSEVRALITNGENAKTMLLFAQALPSTSEGYFLRTSAELSATVESWSFEDLTSWLTHVTREEIEDAAWVHALRKFVLPKSEVLWERVKSMLGVPPELDIESPDASASRSCAKVTTLNIDPIHPTAYTPALQLDDILEAAEEGFSTLNAFDQVVGLRVSTSLAFPSLASRAVSPAPHIRSRTTSQGSVPARSSPLVPKLPSPPRSRAQANGGALRGGTVHGSSGARAHSRAAACPMFPSSFDKLGLQPTLLSVRYF